MSGRIASVGGGGEGMTGRIATVGGEGGGHAGSRVYVVWCLWGVAGLIATVRCVWGGEHIAGWGHESHAVHPPTPPRSPPHPPPKYLVLPLPSFNIHFAL